VEDGGVLGGRVTAAARDDVWISTELRP